ncbi:Protein DETOXIFICATION 12 [Linum perenne]
MGSHNDNAMDQRLLIPSKSQSHGGGDGGAGDDSVASCEFTWSVFVEEVKRLGYIAGPMVAINLSQYLLQVISLMMVGHLGELQLSSTAIAVSLSSVTGFSVILGMSSALETLCGQAYGAGQYRIVGTLTYTAIFCLLLVCIPLSILWVYMDKILVFVGQDPVISHEAGIFQMWLIPSLFAYGMAQPLVRYLQAQSLIIPMLITAVITLCFHVPVCWYLVFRTRLQNVGAALAMCLSNWLSFASLALYVMNSSSCAKTMVPISTDLFRGIGEFFRYAIPSAVMVCLEWWSFELLVLLSGLLPNPALETSVLSVCLTTIATFYSIPYGLGAAASTRVSNELGRGKPELARISVFSVMSIAVAEALVVSLSLYACRHAFGYSFSNEKEVIDYVTRMAPLICLSVIMDSLQGVLSGIARGCGWQHIGAYINLGAFYLCGIPVGIALGFWTDLRGKGLWIGVQVGAFTQTLLMFFVTFCTNWEKQARDARERILKGESTVTNPLI